MKKKLIMTGMMVLTAGMVRAATINWVAEQIHPSPDLTQISTRGLALEAWSFNDTGSVDQWRNTVFFDTANNSGVPGPATVGQFTWGAQIVANSTAFYTTDPPANSAYFHQLKGAWYSQTTLVSDNNRITISGLEIGKVYEIQLFVADDRDHGQYREVKLTADDSALSWASISSNNNTDVISDSWIGSNIAGQPTGSGTAVTGTFMADATTQSFYILLWNATEGGNITGQINAYQLREIPPGSADLSTHTDAPSGSDMVINVENSGAAALSVQTRNTVADTGDYRGIGQSFQWNSNGKLDGIGLHINQLSGFEWWRPGMTNVQNYVLYIHDGVNPELSGAQTEIATYEFKITYSMIDAVGTNGYLYIGGLDLELVNGAWYGFQLSPSTNAVELNRIFWTASDTAYTGNTRAFSAVQPYVGTYDNNFGGAKDFTFYMKDDSALISEIDGVPVWWILEYFATTAGFSGADDPDSDGMTNLEEYLADTVPVDPDSLLALLDVMAVDGTSTVTWVNGGTNANVDLLYRSTLTVGSWSAIHLLDSPSQTTNSHAHATSAANAFYRLEAARND